MPETNLAQLLQQAAAQEGASGDQALRGAAIGSQISGAANQRRSAAQGRVLASSTQLASQAQAGAQRARGQALQSLGKISGDIVSRQEAGRERDFAAGQAELNRDLTREQLAQIQENNDRLFKMEERRFRMDQFEQDLSNVNAAIISAIDPTTGKPFPGMEALVEQSERLRDGLSRTGSESRADVLIDVAKLRQAAFFEQNRRADDNEVTRFGLTLDAIQGREERLQNEAFRKETLGLALSAVENASESNLGSLELTADEIAAGFTSSPTRPYSLMLESVGVFDEGQKDLLRLVLTEQPDPQTLRKFFTDNGVDRQEFMILKAFIEQQVSGQRVDTAEGTVVVPSPLMRMIDKLAPDVARKSRLMGQNAISALRGVSVNDLEVNSRHLEDIVDRAVDTYRAENPDASPEEMHFLLEKQKEASRQVAERSSGAVGPRTPNGEPAPLPPLAAIVEQQFSPDNEGNESAHDRLAAKFTKFVKRDMELILSVPDPRARAILKAEQDRQGTEELIEEGLIPDPTAPKAARAGEGFGGMLIPALVGFVEASPAGALVGDPLKPGVFERGVNVAEDAVFDFAEGVVKGVFGVEGTSTYSQRRKKFAEGLRRQAAAANEQFEFDKSLDRGGFLGFGRRELTGKEQELTDRILKGEMTAAQAKAAVAIERSRTASEATRSEIGGARMKLLAEINRGEGNAIDARPPRTGRPAPDGGVQLSPEDARNLSRMFGEAGVPGQRAPAKPAPTRGPAVSGRRLNALRGRIKESELRAAALEDELKSSQDALKAERRDKGKAKTGEKGESSRALDEIRRSVKSGSLSEEDAKALSKRVEEEGLDVDEIRREIRRIVARTGPQQIF